MKTYKYSGVTASGTPVAGEVKANSEREAAIEIKEICHIITKIEEVSELGFMSRNLDLKRVKEKDLAIICSQFSIILNSGLSVVSCVKMVAQQTQNKQVRKVLFAVAQDVDAGFSLAHAFENNGEKFPKTFIETIRAGEESGALDTCFTRLQKYYENSSKAKEKIASALTYPAIVMVVAIIVFIIIMVVAIPMFTKTFEELGADLPGVTKALIAISKFMTTYWWALVMIFAAIGGGYMYANRTEKGRSFISNFRLTKSPLKKLNSLDAASMFANTMSTMLASGLPIVNALNTTAGVIGNYTYSKAVIKVREGVETGRSLVECMEEEGHFSKMLTEMTGVGEKSGSLESTLEVIGDYFSNELDVATNKFLSMLEPVITVVLALVTAVLLLAVYLPMFNMYGSI